MHTYPADLVTFTEAIFNRNVHFLHSVNITNALTVVPLMEKHTLSPITKLSRNLLFYERKTNVQILIIFENDFLLTDALRIS